MSVPTEFKNVTAIAKANVYFDGKVVSHSILFPDGSVLVEPSDRELEAKLAG